MKQLFVFVLSIYVWGRVSLWSPNRPGTHYVDQVTKTHLPLLGLKACATIPVLNKTIIEKSQAISALRGSPQTQGQSASQWVSGQPGPQRETLYLKLQVRNNTESQDKSTHEEHKGNVLRVKRKAKSIRDQSGNNAEQKLTSHTHQEQQCTCRGGPQDKPKASSHICFRDKAPWWWLWPGAWAMLSYQMLSDQ